MVTFVLSGAVVSLDYYVEQILASIFEVLLIVLRNFFQAGVCGIFGCSSFLAQTITKEVKNITLIHSVLCLFALIHYRYVFPIM